MEIQDLVLLTILAIGGIIINWNIIRRDIFQIEQKPTDFIAPKKLHIKTRKREKKKVS